MAASNPPVNGVAFIVYIALEDFANPGSYKANPTLAAGDAKVSIDGGAFANLATLPAVTPAAGIAVKVSLSAGEMTGDNIFIQLIDQTATKEWADYAFNIQTVAALWATATQATNIQADTDDIQTRLPAALTAGGNMKSDMLALNGGAQSAADLKDFSDDGYDPATNKIQGVVLVDTLTTYTGNTPQTGDSFARIGVAGAGLTNIDLPNQSFDLTGNITGNLSGSVGSVTGAVGSVTGAVGSVTGNVGGNVNGNVVGSVASVTADVGITQGAADKVWLSAARTLTSFGTLVADVATAVWASAARTLTSFGTLTADVADKLLGRNLAGGSDGGRTVQDALRILRNKRSIAAGTLTVTLEDDATPAWTAAVTTAVSNPVNSIDP